MMYAVSVVRNVVAQVIVGNASWAVENLGGEWVDSESKVGVGWLLVDGKIVPPPAPEIPDVTV